MAPPEFVMSTPCPLVPVFVERPILFSAPMVRALLDGSKTQTRRVVKPRRDRGIGCDLAPHEIAGEVNGGDFMNTVYGAHGDRLWVRETHLNWWKLNPVDPTGPRVFSHVAAFAADGYQLELGERWTPSIHMLRAASRIDLEITGVRVERLQDISEADAYAEGIRHADVWGDGTAVGFYRALWEQINGAGSWAANPWVWVVEFRRIKE